MMRLITVDGPAGSGKSTVSRLLAEKLGALYLDTGAMYRAVALQAKRKGVDTGNQKGLGELCRNLDLSFRTEEGGEGLFLGGEDISLAIRSPEMDMLASAISAVGEVRDAMTELQRRIGREGSLVAEGRDMGTVVFPDADFKFFVTASPEIRAERRFRERIGRGESVSRGAVEEDLRRRDDQDMNRPIAPLRPAEDALVLDTSELSPEQVVEEILGIVEKGGMP